MAQTSNATREPSMEEILASIRRIIEDSDVTRQSAPAAPAFPARGEVAAFRRPAPAAEQPEEQAEKPVMMRDILKDEPVPRGPLDEGVKAAPEIETEAVEEEDEIVLDAQNDDRRDTDMQPSAPVAEVRETALPGTTPGALDQLHEMETADRPEADAEEPSAGTAQPAPEEPAPATAEPVAKAPAASHILSGVAERQVAAAFQDLSHAVRSEPRRSFDEIAAELLQPMLQDWLDTNLPTLVERLVREEIERVVRGSR